MAMPLPNPSVSGLSTAAPTPSSPASSATATATAAATAAAASRSTTHTLSYVPYFTAGQLDYLYTQQRAAKMSETKWISNRNVATGFIHAVAARLGFPQRTTATAQIIYQRFHLFYPPSDFVLHEVALASLFVASKLNDTPKKARDILLASYALRFPELVRVHGDIAATAVAGTKRKAPSSSHPDATSPSSSAVAAGTIGTLSEDAIDATVLETDRKRLMALEKLVLESVRFHFQLRAQTTLALVIKIARRWSLSEAFARTAWRVAADMHRTPAPLQYPPNVVAAASVYAAALLAYPPPTEAATREVEREAMGKGGRKEERGEREEGRRVKGGETQQRMANRVVERFRTAAWPPASGEGADEAWRNSRKVEEELGCCIEDVEETVHELLDLYLSQVSHVPTSLSSRATGGTPASASDVGPSSAAAARRALKPYEFAPPPLTLVDWINARFFLSSPSPSAGAGTGKDLPNHLTSTLTDLKIFLRGIEYQRDKDAATCLGAWGVEETLTQREDGKVEVAFEPRRRERRGEWQERLRVRRVKAINRGMMRDVERGVGDIPPPPPQQQQQQQMGGKGKGIGQAEKAGKGEKEGFVLGATRFLF